MKKILLLLILLLSGCSSKPKYKYWHAVIQGYDYSYQTSEVQENTHDVRLAICKNETYIEVSENYNKTYVALKYTGKLIYYRVYNNDKKVSNKGWELL